MFEKRSVISIHYLICVPIAIGAVALFSLFQGNLNSYSCIFQKQHQFNKQKWPYLKSRPRPEIYYSKFYINNRNFIKTISMKKFYPLCNYSPLLLFICLFFSISAHAQLATGHSTPATKPPVSCASKILLDQADPRKLAAFEQSMYAKALERSGSRTSTDTVNYTIPVVFHIIHENGAENIPDSDLWDALDLLNKAFKHASPYDPAGGVNININFCLSSSAITRSVSPLTDLTMETGNGALKAIDMWDPTSYVNIWVVNSITSLTMGPGVAGYSSMPASHGAADDGIVVEAGYLNSHPENVAVLIHEMGHYLGLYHTFEGGCGNSDCLLNGDHVCDTPPDNSTAGVLCSSSANTCHSDSDDASINNPFRAIALGGLGDQPDMIQNFMDYGFQTCQNTFTDGQRSRMRDGLFTSRHSLLEHPGLCQGCTTPIIATLTIADTLPAGIPVTFNIATSGTGLLVVWQFNSNSVVGGTSITQTFPVAGMVYINVFVIDPASPGCNFQLHDTVYFSCPVPQPIFSASPSGLMNPGQAVTFSTVNNGYNYTWNVDGTAAGTGTSFNYTAGTLGQLITLEADNGTCKSVSQSYYANPGNCENSKQNNTWYFGENAGINFNVSPPQAIVGRVNTTEGAAVLSDDNGTPLFHSNGTNVGNSQTGNILLNGSGLTGSPTTTQSALFVPQPGSSRYVYLFTVDYQATEGAFGGGIFYSIIDKLGDGGQGEVTIKNQLLLAPVTEKVTAVRNTAGDGIWVIAHKYASDAFYTWSITASGISGPVISHAGSVQTAPPGALAGYFAIGEMKASPAGNKIALAIAGSNKFEVFDFDKSTGMLSNAISLSSSLTIKAYGIAFSPDERFLYGSTVSPPYNIIRYDLHAGTPAAVNTSAVLIGTAGGALQLAPDGKIYGARGGRQYLAVIANPNAVNPAACGYVNDGFRLADGTVSELGLVNPIQSTLASVKPEIAGQNKVCLNATTQLFNYNIDPVGNATYTWVHHGPNAFTALTDSTATVSYSNVGNDTLIALRSAACGILSDTLYITSGSPSAFSIGPDRLVCPGTVVVIDGGAGLSDYYWNNGATTRNNTLYTAGMVSVQVTTAAGCIASDSLMVSFYSLPSLHLGRDTSICAAETLSLNAPAGMDSYLWSTGATGNNIVVTDSGTYTVAVGKYGCIFRDTIRVQENVPLNLISNDTLVLCSGMSNIYTAASGFDNYSWHLPSGAVTATQSVNINDPGYYILTYSNHCGTGHDSIYHYIPQIFAQDTIITCDDTLQLISDLHLVNFIYGSNDYIGNTRNGDTVTIFRSGFYIAISNYTTASPGCYIVQSMYILVDTALVRPSKTIDLGNDTSYCEGNVLALNAGAGFDWYHWNTGSVDSTTTVYGFGTYTVTAHLCGFDFTDTIVISNNHTVAVNLGPDVTSCNPTAVIMDAGSGYDWYVWSTGQTTQQINGSGFGQYSVSTGLNGCIARDTVTITDCALTVPDIKDNCTQPFYLSPNPGTDVVTLGSRCSLINTVRVAVSSSDGKMIGDKEGNLASVNVFLNQLMQGLSPAMYVVMITNETERYYFKWMIIK
ncbi:MAG: C-terminal target protein [Bacteroidetes bacterium]|nr:C-terminal target protein [Bacteroidota bacterium]